MSKDDGKGSLGRLWSGAGRGKPVEEKVVPLTRPGVEVDRAYVAFKLRDNAERMQIIRAANPSRFPSSKYLLDISFDRFHQAAFTLVYTFMVVDVTGSNLEQVVHAINFGNCDCIREFAPRQHDHPGKGEPLIESIEITTADENWTK